MNLNWDLGGKKHILEKILILTLFFFHIFGAHGISIFHLIINFQFEKNWFYKRVRYIIKPINLFTKMIQNMNIS